MPVSERYLLEAAWYALEQCGRLLHDAITLYETGRYATASGIAMLAREELGRARILLALAEEVHSGRPLTLVELEGAIADHVVKQAAGQLTLGFSTPPESGLSRLMALALTDTPSEESHEAWKELQRAINRLAARKPHERHTTRQRALFVDPNDAGTDWHRPASFTREESQRLLMEVMNDYSIFRLSLESQERYRRVHEVLDGWDSRPDLPPVTWPEG